MLNFTKMPEVPVKSIDTEKSKMCPFLKLAYIRLLSGQVKKWSKGDLF